MGQIQNFYKSDFSTFWLGEPDLSHLRSIWLTSGLNLTTQREKKMWMSNWTKTRVEWNGSTAMLPPAWTVSWDLTLHAHAWQTWRTYWIISTEIAVLVPNSARLKRNGTNLGLFKISLQKILTHSDKKVPIWERIFLFSFFLVGVKF